jgi:predicted histone-like DNA-binding protein
MLEFNVIQRKDPRDQTAGAKFYATLKKVQTVDLEYIANELAGKSSISKGDVISIMTNLIDLVPKELASGRTINLGKLGTFWLNISSREYETADDVSPEAIKKVNVRFKPSASIKSLLGRLKFERLEFI